MKSKALLLSALLLLIGAVWTFYHSADKDDASEGSDVTAELGFMWSLAKGDDPDLRSTALIGLYQFSQLHLSQQDVGEVY